MKQGYIKIYRSFYNWEWYHDINVRLLFMHLLLHANYEDKKWRGTWVKRGQIITSREKLANEVGISVQQLRTAIEKLKSTSEITCVSTNGFTRFCIQNFNKYQDGNQEDNQGINKRVTSDQPAINQRITTTKEGKKERRKEEEKKYISVDISKEKNTHKFKSPKLNDVFEFMQEYSALKDFTLSVNSESENFFDFYSSKGWQVGKETMKDWRSSARMWLRKNNDEKKKPEKISFRSGKLVEDNTAKGTFDRIQKLREKLL